MVLCCPECAQIFDKPINLYRQAVEKRGQTRFFCSRTCLGINQRRPARLHSGICKGCGEPFSRKLTGHKDKGLFCTRRCSAIHTNAQRTRSGPRIKPRPPCPNCGKPKNYGSRECQECRNADFNTRTLGELRLGRNVFAFHAKVRGLARSAYKGSRSCAACGYLLQVDICHIRPVSDFPDSATLAEVNGDANLMALDKRCHWEFDHGYLRLVDGLWIHEE